jgi:hypothetical protein
MALVVNDRVKETSTTTGTGTLSLAGAVSGFESFVAGIGNTNTTYYSIVNEDGEFEVGIGTVTDAATDTLSRDTILSSSNSDAAVNFAAGTKDVFCTLPASKAVILDSSGNIVANNGSNLTNLNADNLASGTVPDARFPATLPAVSGANLTNLDASDLASGTVPDARFPATLPAASGVNLTSLNATNIASGTLSSDRLPTVPTTKGGTGLTSIGSANQVLAVNSGGTALEYQTPTTGDITAVTAGDGLTGGGSSGDVTLNVGAGTGVTVNADDIAIGQDVATSASPTFAGLTTTADINFGDNDKAQFGAGNDLQIYHDGSNSFISDEGTGVLAVTTNGTAIQLNSAGEQMGAFNQNGSVDLFYNNVKKFETTSGGVQTTGTVNVNGAYTLPTSDGSANQVLTTDGSGAVTFQTPTVGDITGVTAGNGLTGGGTTGDVTLNVGAGTGVTVNANDIAIGQSVATSASPTFAGLTTTADINFGDNDKAIFGAGNDLQIYHDSASNVSFIEESGTSNLHIRGASIVLKSQVDNDDYIKCNENAAVELYYSNAKKLETTTGGIAVTGAITATGDVTAFFTSDKNLKQNIVNIDNSLDKVSKLNGVYYNWTKEALEKNKHLVDEKEVGVIAQDVEAVLPELVATREDGSKAVRYERLCAVLIESVKELKKEIELLKNPGA